MTAHPWFRAMPSASLKAGVGDDMLRILDELGGGPHSGKSPPFQRQGSD
jgi:hypothetical protein